MSALAALLLQAAAPPLPPADWSTLPDLPVTPTPEVFDPSGFVRREAEAGRCKAEQTPRGWEIHSPVAVLVDARGTVQRIVPRAIDCSTVEQYTAGYVSTLARRAVAAPGGLKQGWYRYAVTYRWQD